MLTRALALATLAALLIPARPAAAESRLSLDQAYRTALRNNPTIAVLRERVVQSEVARYRAWSALKPTATFQGSYTRQPEITVDFLSGLPDAFKALIPAGTNTANTFQKPDLFVLQLAASVPLVRAAAYPRIGAARTGVEVARLREVRSRQDFLLRIAQAYYLVVSREDAVKALETKLAVDRKHLAAAKDRLSVGQSPRSEVMRADLVATQDEQNLLAQRNALQAARRALAILIGVPGSPQVERPSEPASPQSSEDQMIAIARGARLDLKAAGLSVNVAEKSLKSVWMTFVPSLDLSAFYRYNTPVSSFTQQNLWAFTVTLSVPLYDAGQRYAELRDARSRLIEAQRQQEALNLDIEAELVRLRADLASATAGVVSARKAVALARTTLEDMEASFQVGAATQLDVLDAAQRALDADLQLTSSLFTRDLSRLSLLHAQGRFDPLRADR
jgi:outer membrane protein TolC